QVAAALGSVSAFAEVPQLLSLPADASRAPMFVAANAGARLGIVGDTIAFDRDDMLERLSAMRVTVEDEHSNLVSSAQGSAGSGRPDQSGQLCPAATGKERYLSGCL
ncbi:MAG: hypothetical protein MUF47_12605, partial [Porphyrobacter sp.]|nr:hypothetical protein [Porphyrobacter sp.]